VCEPVPFSVSTFAGTLVWISLSYSGFNAAVYVAGEARDPARVVPSAMLRATIAVALIYFALNLIFVGFVPCEDVIGRPDVAFAAASSLLGDTGAQIVRAIVALALLSSVSSMIMAGPRVFAQMADDGVFPRALKFRGEVPTAAILVQAALAILLVLVSDLRSLLGYLGLTLSLSAALTVFCLFVLRRRHGAAAIPVTGSVLLPGVYVVATLALALLASSRQPMEWLAAGITVLTGLVAYRVFRR
jgi:APA family basic amino acid/polyamine antiporter